MNTWNAISNFYQEFEHNNLLTLLLNPNAIDDKHIITKSSMPGDTLQDLQLIIVIMQFVVLLFITMGVFITYNVDAIRAFKVELFNKANQNILAYYLLSGLYIGGGYLFLKHVGVIFILGVVISIIVAIIACIYYIVYIICSTLYVLLSPPKDILPTSYSVFSQLSPIGDNCVGSDMERERLRENEHYAKKRE